MITSPDNDNNRDEPMVFIVIAKAYETEGGQPVDLHVMLTAPDDDSAVRLTLNALSEEGFIEADLDQIGMITGAPDEEPHAFRLSRARSKAKSRSSASPELACTALFCQRPVRRPAFLFVRSRACSRSL